jgi:hypothetical protein
MSNQLTIREKQARAVELLQTEIEWYEEDRGRLACPGKELHTKKTGEKDTILYLDGAPTLWCFHESCADIVEDANSMLRNELADPMNREERKKRKNERFDRYEISHNCQLLLANLDWLLEKYAWEFSSYSPTDSWNLFFRTLWNPDDLLWVGNIWDTGPLKGPGHFKTARDWLLSPPNRYTNHFTTSSTFKPVVLDRSNRNVETTPYVVVEFDSLSPDKERNRRLGGAMLNYLRADGLEVVAVVDSGNKSYHGWVRNNEKMTDSVKFTLCKLGADTKTMRAAQPVRVPGARRENGNIQSLLWIEGEATVLTSQEGRTA